MFSEGLFWIVMALFGLMAVARWAEALKAERFPTGKVVAVTVAVVVALAVSFFRKFAFDPSGVWGPIVSLVFTLVDIALLVVALIIYVVTAPDIPCTPARERRRECSR